MNLNSYSPDLRSMWLAARGCFVDTQSDKKELIKLNLGNNWPKLLETQMRKANMIVHGGAESPLIYRLMGGHLTVNIPFVAGIDSSSLRIVIPISFDNTRFKNVLRNGVNGLSECTLERSAIMMFATSLTAVDYQIVNMNDGNSTTVTVTKEDTEHEFRPEMILANIARSFSNPTMPPAMEETNYHVKNFMSKKNQLIYLSKSLPAPSCRNCQYSTPKLDDSIDAGWGCFVRQEVLTQDECVTCEHHRFEYDMVQAEFVEDDGMGSVIYKLAGGETIVNGTTNPATNCFDSSALCTIMYGDKGLYNSLDINSKEELDKFIAKKLNWKDVKCSNCINFSVGKSLNGVGTCADNVSKRQIKSLFPNAVRDCANFIGA